jgi:ribosome-associated protein
LVKTRKRRTSKNLAALCARAAEDKLAHDVLILNLTKIELSPTDYFVICTCDSDVQVAAVVDEIYKKCRELKLSKPRAEGLDGNFWVLLDFFDVVVHIMHRKAREFYKLEKLWGDAQFLKLDGIGKPKVITDKELKSII